MNCSHLHYRNILLHFIILKNNLFSLLFVPPVITSFFAPLPRKVCQKCLDYGLSHVPFSSTYPNCFLTQSPTTLTSSPAASTGTDPKVESPPSLYVTFSRAFSNLPIDISPFLCYKKIFSFPQFGEIRREPKFITVSQNWGKENIFL